MKQKQDQVPSSICSESQAEGFADRVRYPEPGKPWNDEQLKGRLSGWCPEFLDNEEELDSVAEDLIQEGRYDSFREAFRTMLRDPSRTLAEKAAHYFADFEKDSVLSPWGYFKFLWDRLFPQDAFPIAEDPDPPRER
jgi:hypothetical protein